MSEIGKRIKQLRQKAGLNQRELADMAGVSFSTLRRWEVYGASPRVEEISKLAAALHVTEAELLNGPADTKARFEIIFNKELWEGEDIDMTGNLFSLLLSSDGHIGIKGANKFNSEDEIMDFCIKAAEEMQRAFRAQRERGALAGA